MSNNKSRPVVIIFSILAALQVVTGAAAVGDVIGAKLFGLFAILVAAIQVGMTFYVQNTVVPMQDVAAYQASSGVVVAGPAAGATNGTPVSVEPGTFTEEMPREIRKRDEYGRLTGDARIIAIAAIVAFLVLLFLLVVFDARING